MVTMSNQTGEQHRANGAKVWQAPTNWRYYFSPQCQEDQEMKRMQFVETTLQAYDAHVHDFQTLKNGGRVEVKQITTEPWFQVRVYHNPRVSDIGLTPQWTMIALAYIDRKDEAYSNYFIFKEVEMGTKTVNLGLNGLTATEEVKS